MFLSKMFINTPAFCMAIEWVLRKILLYLNTNEAIYGVCGF